jgi:hypothetical protein
VETLPATGEFLFTQMYDRHIENIMMNPLNVTCGILLTIWLTLAFFASSVNMFFTTDELTEMGVLLGAADIQEES